ncbi:SMC domain-containing protein [Megasphaera sp. BL7]|uniref:AAA family ATPase n=1 Tax=unclassified Megasphaera TaxID=2626256 RepID=UPI0003579AE0|nr:MULTISPECIES: AAA family ATPase [unclassified Megasphaera]EPP14708.1 SMC domain-containing protein [Megasphaera sp. BL7]EPP17847.1 SMC domain-containing protein [Megasphaera sp. NM10]
MSVKIRQLEIENVKRVKAVTLTPTENGLTVIGGRNGQGKTSVLDAIAWALGGNKLKPSESQRIGSAAPPSIHIELSNGLVVERKGKSSALHVIDPSGQKAGQQLLDSFIEKLALNLPKFMDARNDEKAETLLQIIGVGDKLAVLDRQEKSLYNQRLEVGRIADRKKKHAEEMAWYPDAPAEPVSASELIQRQQAILAKNGENQRKREKEAHYNKVLAEAQIAFDRAKAALKQAEQDCVTARKAAENLQDESTAELEQDIANIDAINTKVRANAEKNRVQAEADELAGQYGDLTQQIESVKDQRMKLLDSADMPLPGLSVQDGELTYNGQKWDCMSGAEQLQVATAIVRKLNPDCGFVLMDKLEQMDPETLAAFGQWLEGEGLQVIATRVGTDDTCSIIIEDGYIKEDRPQEVPQSAPKAETPKWTPGTF